MGKEISTYEITRRAVETAVEETDLISIKNAAELLGVIPGTISRMLDAGTLPWYQFDNHMENFTGKRPSQRFTSKTAIEALKAIAQARSPKGLRRGQYKVGNE